MPVVQKLSANEFNRDNHVSKKQYTQSEPAKQHNGRSKEHFCLVIDKGDCWRFSIAPVEGAEVWGRTVRKVDTYNCTLATEDGIAYMHLAKYTNVKYSNTWRLMMRSDKSEIITIKQGY